ncbi:hypothetical protein Cob_v007717 [Colletotrichum orbiculare MAFF 240422]|uniref:Uncharacterized protein n=1 Tax=Colletotrichum orbiculare (strain 104-T / ATCC 96160 / CBS 514.97 / LARS 414 / MAFF 240422) TaxID=1213857 RepID=A0A484FPT1_COLOR|nr:hypothetical protein Cob_v007717 [Colletotrichum orbiculare MAFF 240422]
MCCNRYIILPGFVLPSGLDTRSQSRHVFFPTKRAAIRSGLSICIVACVLDSADRPTSVTYTSSRPAIVPLCRIVGDPIPVFLHPSVSIFRPSLSNLLL